MERYLGDGVYAEIENGTLILTTRNGVYATNTIYLEDSVLSALDTFRADASKQSLPVIYDLDEHGEATGTIHVFCSEQCREQSEVDGANGTSSDCVDDSQCETCGKPV